MRSKANFNINWLVRISGRTQVEGRGSSQQVVVFSSYVIKLINIMAVSSAGPITGIINHYNQTSPGNVLCHLLLHYITPDHDQLHISLVSLVLLRKFINKFGIEIQTFCPQYLFTFKAFTNILKVNRERERERER